MTRWAPLLLVALCVAIHWPLDRADFTFDDRDFVERNPLVTSLAGAAAGFAYPFPPDQPERALYRPLTGASYALDRARAGLDARAFHATNVWLYVALVLLVHRLALAYGLGAGFALAVACLFAAHPVHCDAVDSISGRSEVLSLAFAVAALLAFLRNARAPAAAAFAPSNLAAAALYAAACLSKETGSVMLAVLLVHRLALCPRPAGAPRFGGWLFRPLLPHALVLLAYALLRTAVLGRLSPEAAILADAAPLTRFWTMGSVFWLDFQQLLLPVTLAVDFHYQVAVGITERASWAAVAGWLGMAACGALALRLGVRASQTSAPLPRESAVALCGFALFLVPLVPTSHVLDIGALFAERFLFAPSLGFVVLLVLGARAALAAALPERPARVVAVALATLLTLVAGVHSQSRALEWRDAVQFWRSAGARITDKRVHTNLAAAYITRGQLDLALAQTQAALVLEPDYRPALGNRGVVLLKLGRLEEARETFTRLSLSDPDDALAWYNLGNIALASGEHAQAASHFERALQIAPGFSDAQAALEVARSAARDSR